VSQASDRSRPGAQPPPAGGRPPGDAESAGGAAANPSAPAASGLRLGLLLLWLAALALALTGLGGPPLLDWDEGIVARVSLELSQLPWPQRLWPTYWGEPYLNKPPGLHLLVATAIDAWRAMTGAAATALPPEWLLRLVPALISSLLVPLLALLQWRLRPGDRLTALLTGAIALTLLPLVRHGHLLMLDGCQLVAMALLWWALLGAGSRQAGPLCHGQDNGLPPELLRDRLHGQLHGQPPALEKRPTNALINGLLAGLAASALLLLKAPVALPVLGGGLLLRLLDRDLNRKCWTQLGLGLAIGLLPGLAWHGGHLLERGDGALVMWLGQGFARVGNALEGNSGGPLTPLLEVLEGGWPWLPLWPFGIALAWRQRRSRPGLWCLGLTLLCSALVLPLRTQLPWYSLLLWPPFALVCAPVLAWLVRRGRRERPPLAALLAGVPRVWSLLGALLLLAGLLAATVSVLAGAGLVPGSLAAGQQSGALAGTSSTASLPGLPATGPPDLRLPGAWISGERLAERGLALARTPLSHLAPSLLLLGTGLLLGGLLLSAARPQRRRRGLLVLLLGDGLALALLLASPLWLWELNESWPVADGVALLQGTGAGGDGGELRLWRQGERPSLNWYSGRRIRPEDHVNLEAGRTIWLLGLESAQAPGLRCELKGRRGSLRLEHCRAEPRQQQAERGTAP